MRMDALCILWEIIFATGIVCLTFSTRSLFLCFLEVAFKLPTFIRVKVHTKDQSKNKNLLLLL